MNSKPKPVLEIHRGGLSAIDREKTLQIQARLARLMQEASDAICKCVWPAYGTGPDDRGRGRCANCHLDIPGY